MDFDIDEFINNPLYKLHLILKGSGTTIYGAKYICEKYILHLEPIDENNSLAFVRELLDSNDEDNYIIAAEILNNLKIKK